MKQQMLPELQYINKNSTEDDLVLQAPKDLHYHVGNFFNLVDSYLKEKGLSWDEYTDICTEGPQPMNGKQHGLTAQVKIMPKIGTSH